MKKFLLTVLSVLAVVVMTSCSTSKPVVDGEWLITNACGVSTEGGDNPTVISFDGKGQMNGNASVNSFFGSYTLNGDTLKLDHVGMTRMMGGSMEIEDAVTKALNSVVTIKIDGDNATIFDAEGKEVMQLQRKK